MTHGEMGSGGPRQIDTLNQLEYTYLKSAQPELNLYLCQYFHFDYINIIYTVTLNMWNVELECKHATP